MSSSRVEEPANLAVVAGNGLSTYQKRRGFLPRPALPRHLLLDLSGEGLEEGGEGLEGEEGVCLHVRGIGHRELKAGARQLPHQEQEEL